MGIQVLLSEGKGEPALFDPKQSSLAGGFGIFARWLVSGSLINFTA